MMCYKDRTWCRENTCTHKNKCDRFFTDTDAANAEAWWGSEGAPVCFFGERPKCFTWGSQWISWEMNLR